MQIKKNTSLILALLLPIVMMALVAISIYIPSATTKPTYDFLYALGEEIYDSQQESYVPQYLVKNAVLLHNPTYLKKDAPVKAKLFIYDMQKNASKEISFQEAKKLTLFDRAVSPDGFEVLRGNDMDELFLFWGGTGNVYKTVYIKGRFLAKKLNVQLLHDSNQYFRFVAWIKK